VEVSSVMRRASSLVSLVVLIAACSDSTSTEREQSPLAGLSRSAASDSAGNAPPGTAADTAQAVPSLPDSLNAGPGHFRGVVRSSEGVSGPDTLAGSKRLADVKVVAFPRQANGEPGAQVAAVTTNAQGEWQLPTMPSGNYIVTFTPPANSTYQGIWVIATAHPRSHEWPWWVTLPKR
jgi:hypothetical protein